MSSPDVSVVVVSYRTPDLLAKCLESLRAFAADLPVEAIVVDNASGEGTLKMVRTRFPEVILIANPRNVGFAAANNQGFRAARGRHLLMLNSDAFLTERALSRMVDYLDRNPHAGVCAPRLLRPDGSTQRSIRRFPTPRAVLYQHTAFRVVRSWRPLYRDYKMTDFDFRSSADVEQPMGAALLIRKKTLDEVGLFDERFRFYFEEVDLEERIRRRGWAIHYLADATVVHQGSASVRRFPEWVYLQRLHSIFHYFSKRMSRRDLIRFKALFKAGLLLRLAAEVPVDLAQWAIYRTARPNPRKAVRKLSNAALKARFLVEHGWSFICRY